MRAMILAAGRGERMGALTKDTPKPLLRVASHYLIEYVIANIKRAGIFEIVINVFYRGDQIKEALGDGTRYGVHITYSEEKEALEVGGGIAHALPLLGEEPFIVVSGDIISDYPLAQLSLAESELAHLVMVDNPPFHQGGDFGLRDGYADFEAQPRLCFGNIGLYRPQLFAACPPGFVRWRELVFPAILQQRVTAEHYQGSWYNLGTVQDLDTMNQRAREDSNLRPLASETNTLSN
jgi:N-acetyl-alpha-D-muramate 1-phosphate uridylyltransferase